MQQRPILDWLYHTEYYCGNCEMHLYFRWEARPAICPHCKESIDYRDSLEEHNYHESISILP